MATLSCCLSAIEKRLGFSGPRISAIAKKLLEADVLPAGGPGRAPELDKDDFLRLVIACVVSKRLRDADESVRVYSAMTIHGADVTGAPATVPENVFERLAVLVEVALGVDPAARSAKKAKIDFVTSWPEISIFDYGCTERFRLIGANASLWENNQHRKSTTISVATLADAYLELFGDKN